MYTLHFPTGYGQSVDDCRGLPHDNYLQYHDGTCYQFVTYRIRNYRDASRDCERKGGRLAVIDCQITNDYIQRQLYKTYSVFGKFWIGLSSQNAHHKGAYVWADGTRLNFTNWALNEGNNSHEDCVSIDTNRNGQWSDEYCGSGNTRPYVCQYKSTYVPTTSTAKTSPSPSTTQTPTVPQHVPDITHCPEGLHRNRYLQYHNGVCYQFIINHQNDYRTAKSECEYNGGTLLFLKSKEINDYIYSQLRDTYNVTSGRLWIGLYDIGHEGRWVWADENEFLVYYTNWAAGEGDDTFII